MAGRKYLLIILAFAAFSRAYGQSLTFKEADSLSYGLYTNGNWQNLIDYGKRAIATGTDFPLLRLRIGYAYFNTGNYGEALSQYQMVLSRDSHNQLAHLYAYWCHRYLNQDAQASYHAAFLDTSIINTTHISPFGLIDAALESGVEMNTNTYRGTALYNRLGISNRLGWKFQLDESVLYFRQSIYHPYHNSYNSLQRNYNTISNNSVSQCEYYGKLNYVLSNKWVLYGGYHYINAKYREEDYNNNIGLIGLKYTGSIIGFQADADLGQISNHAVYQYNTLLTIMPAGNLNLYFISRASLLRNSDKANVIFSQTAGERLTRNFWLESNVTLGSQNNYMDADGLYVYNSIDITKFRASGTTYYAIGNHALLYLNYTYEQKKDNYTSSNYNQHSITGGLKWKF